MLNALILACLAGLLAHIFGNRTVKRNFCYLSNHAYSINVRFKLKVLCVCMILIITPKPCF